MRAARILPALGIVVTSVLVVVAVAQSWPRQGANGAAPQAAPSFTEPETPEGRRAFHELCPTINRPEVLALLEDPPRAQGLGTSYGHDPDYLICNVSLRQSAVRVEVGTDLTVASMARLSPKAKTLTVRGLPALLEFGTTPMHTATLLVARTPQDTGAYVSIVVITPDAPATESTLVHIAELVLPELP